MARVVVVLLALASSGCAGAGAAPSPDQPRRFTDYDGTGTAASDQCHLSVEERTGGWFCYEVG